MKVMAGIDLHSNNMVCGLVDMDGNRLLHKKLPCVLGEVLKFLKPFKDRLETVAVESTYNWYWLVDGLQDHGYPVVLANPAGIEQYTGLKHADDKSDAYFLAELLRLKILPTGYICDRQRRPVRDLLRRRLGLVRHRTALILSLKSLSARMFGEAFTLREVKSMDVKEAQASFAHPADRLIAGRQVHLIEQFSDSITQLEKMVLAHTRKLPCYLKLQTIPGVGKILALTITLETADIGRFATAGDYASYCRCVESRRTSNSKSKGRNNGKCGNAYLSWAWVEAANFAQRFDAQCQAFCDRKASQTNKIVATKALACKLSKAAWHIMKHDVKFDAAKVFPCTSHRLVIPIKKASKD